MADRQTGRVNDLARFRERKCFRTIDKPNTKRDRGDGRTFENRRKVGQG